MWQIILFIFYFGLFTFLIYKWSFFRKTKLNFTFRYALFLLKILAAGFVLYIYTCYYSDNVRLKSDIWKYYTDASAIYDLAINGKLSMFAEVMTDNNYSQDTENYLNENTEFWFKSFNYNLPNENRTIIKIIVLLMFLTGKNIYLLTLFAVFMAYVGSTSLFLTFDKWFKNREVLLVLFIFTIPSVLFWTSALLKEMLVLFFLGLFFYFWIEKRNFIIGILLWTFLFFTKIYYAIPLIPSIIAYEISLNTYKKTFRIYFIVFSTALLFSIGLHIFNAPVDILEKLSAKQHDFIQMAVVNKAGSYIDIIPLKNNLKNFVIATPFALINVLIRPYLWEVKNPLMLINALENILLLIVLIWLIAKVNRNKVKDIQTFNIFWFLITYVMSVFLIIGYTSPVLGATVRYRAPALVLLFIAFGSLSNAYIPTKINNLLRIASKKHG